MKKVKIFRCYFQHGIEDFEEEINIWLAENPNIEIISTTQFPNSSYNFYTILYEEK